MKKKKKDPDLDPATIKVRLPEEIIYRLLNMKMASSACLNKGFILDGYPRTANDVRNIWLTKIAKEEGDEANPPPAEPANEGEEEEVDPFKDYEVSRHTLPQFVINLTGED